MDNKSISPELQDVMDRCKTKLGRISSKDPSFYLHSFDEISEIMNKSVSLEDYYEKLEKFLDSIYP